MNTQDHDPFYMQQLLVGDPNVPMTILDVGAYVGEIAMKYNSQFSNSKIYCFEPFPESFSLLQDNVSTFDNIVAINKGVSELNGHAKFHSNKFAQTNSLLPSDSEGNNTWGPDLLDTIETVDIELTTIDSFVEAYHIGTIDILKLDVQGAEYMVLNGAKKTMEKGIVKMIYTEIITLPTYEGQRNLDEVLAQYRSCGFRLFNFYNHSRTHSGQLRQVDAIFIKSGN